MVYAIVNMKVTNPDGLARYREHAGAALSKHGGSVLVAGKENMVIEGSATVPDMAAVLSFPDKESAHAWINDPEIAEIHAMRRSAGDVSIVLIS
jgi:uncharacterized protein (DUF1330 family)